MNEEESKNQLFIRIFRNISEDDININMCEIPEVLDIYSSYSEACRENISYDIFRASRTARRYYVYAWYAKTEPKKYFYVGKGTGSRHRHIISDIKKVKEGKKKNWRFEMYAKIQEYCGIDCEILIKNLTEYEALIYEQCKKLEFLENGEVLLCVEGIPSEFDVSHLFGYRETKPVLKKNPVFARYFDDFTVPYFDDVDIESLMKTYFYPYFLEDTNIDVINDKKIIIEWLESKKAKIYRTVSTKTKSIIIQGGLEYETYCKYRQGGRKIYSSKDVISFIKKISNI